MQRRIIALAALAAVLPGTSPASAQEPVGCDKFKWDVTRERAALAQAGIPKLASGSAMTGSLPQAVMLELTSPADAKLPSPPERNPKPDTFAGFTTVTIPANGVYAVALSAAAWIDVMQNGSYLKSQTSSGVSGCDGIRKVVKFRITAGSTTIQVSGVTEPTIKIAVMPVTE